MSAFSEPSLANNFLAEHVCLLRESYQRLTGRALIDASLPDVEAARALFEAPFVVMSHDTATDPVFNYANKAAMELFEMTWPEFTVLPSRLSAEAPNREERARLLAEVTAHGFIDNYSGIRISSTARRFVIDQATVWNLVDSNGLHRGQAATFSAWKFL